MTASRGSANRSPITEGRTPGTRAPGDGRAPVPRSATKTSSATVGRLPGRAEIVPDARAPVPEPPGLPEDAHERREVTGTDPRYAERRCAHAARPADPRDRHLD